MRLGVLSDIHLVEDLARPGAWQNPYDRAGVEERCERARELFDGAGVDAVVLAGDISEDGDVPTLRRTLRLVASSAPTFVVGGNHDGVGTLARAVRAERGPARLAGVRGRPWPELRMAGLPIAPRAGGGWGSLRRPAVAHWGTGVTLFASHFPLLARREALAAAGLRHPGDLADREAVARALASHRQPTVVLSGHLHARDSCAEGPLLQLVCGALVEPPFDATLVSLESRAGTVTLEREAHELSSAPETRDPRMAPARERWRFSPAGGWRREAG